MPLISLQHRGIDKYHQISHHFVLCYYGNVSHINGSLLQFSGNYIVYMKLFYIEQKLYFHSEWFGFINPQLIRSSRVP